jgi:membrane protease YdiL (CAAX protease family)
MNSDRGRTVFNLTLFIAVVLLCGWVGYGINNLLDVPQEESPGMLLWLIAPLITAMLLRAVGGDGWRDAGLKPNMKGNLIWYGIALLVFPVLTATVVFIGVGAGWISLNGFELPVFFQAFALALIPNFLKNIPEEFVWRGYLTPKLASLKLNDFVLYLLVGLIWGLWHIPYYLYFLDRGIVSEFTDVSFNGFVTLSLMITIAWSVVFVELWLLTRSVWPAVLMHMVEDAFVNPLVLDGSFRIADGMDLLIHPVVGIVSILLFVLLGLSLRQIRLRQAQRYNR